MVRDSFFRLFSKRVFPFFLVCFLFLSSASPSYAAVYDYEIPASPAVSDDDYPYWIIFRGTGRYNGVSCPIFYLVFTQGVVFYSGGSYQCTESYLAYTWYPVKSNSWSSTKFPNGFFLSSSRFTYVASNYDVMSASSIYHPRQGNAAFLDCLSDMYPEYTFDPSVWNDTRGDDADSGGGSFDDSGILSGLNKVVGAILDIPNAIVDGLKSVLVFLFVPGDDYFPGQVDGLKTALGEKLPIDAVTSLIESIQTAAAGDMPNVEIDYMGVHGTIVNFDSFRDYKSTIHSWVRGFMFVLLAFYWVDQIYKMIRGTTLYSGSGPGTAIVPADTHFGRGG